MGRRAWDFRSNTYYDWLIAHIFFLVPSLGFAGHLLGKRSIKTRHRLAEGEMTG